MTAALVLVMLAADSRVDMPAPKPDVSPVVTVTRRKPLWDRPAKVEAATMIGLAAADQVQTCRNLRRVGWHEDLLTQSCGKNVAITVGFEAAAIGGAWLLHRTGHDRLARLPMAYMAAASARGLTW